MSSCQLYLDEEKSVEKTTEELAARRRNKKCG
jgi:hypothetical protein